MEMNSVIISVISGKEVLHGFYMTQLEKSMSYYLY